MPRPAFVAFEIVTSPVIRAVVTAIVNCFSVNSPLASVVRIRMETEFSATAAKLAAVWSELPTIANRLLSVEPSPPTSEYVNVSPASTSLVVSVPMAVPTTSLRSTGRRERLISTGVSLTFVTEIVNCFSNVTPPASAARTRME